MSSSPATSRAYVGDATCVVPLAVRRDANALSGGEDARDEHDATTLLVGTGGSLTWYAPFDADATGGRRRACVRVFEDGERVHGGRDFGDGKRVVAWGERRVRVVRASEERSGDGWTLQTESGLPAFGAWVHDVRGVLSASGGDSRDVAVGLSDNSVERWCENVGEHGQRAWTRAARMECESRCLLYTLELSASATWEGMRVAGGTIYNEIQVWGVTDGVVRENCVGHEGSLMRVRFSDDGSSIYSASDDRTARVWNLEDGTGADGSFRTIRPHVVLAGHVARVWDCVRVEGERPVYATGGEDCTVRIWDANAAAGGETLADGVRKREDCELAALRGHRGRGIWRLCALRAPNGSVTLASAGADGSVKLWNMSDWTRTQATSAGSMALHESTTPVPPGRVDKAMTDEVKDVNMADVDAQEGDAQSGKKRKMKSKRRQSVFSADDEFVRVVRVLRHGSLFVATNHGFLYRVKWMRDRETWDWQLAYDNASSLMSMCVEEADEEDVVALADLDGKIIIVRLSRATGECTEVTKIDASEPRLLMDVFFCKGKIFASIVGGVIKCWRIANPTECSFTLKNPYGHRILALDVCENSKVVLVGDQKGNLCVFNVAVDAAELPVIAQKWSAHEKNCSVNVCRIQDGPSFITGGRDSNVCTWNMVRSGDKMELVLASKWTAPSKSSVMFAGVGESGELEHAAGFRETDFVAYSVDDQRQTLRVACKKINMPHDALMGYGDKIIFVYRKAKELHISMRWSESHADSSLDKQTNIWSHG